MAEVNTRERGGAGGLLNALPTVTDPRSKHGIHHQIASTLTSASNLVVDLRALGREDEANQLEEWVRSHS